MNTLTISLGSGILACIFFIFYILKKYPRIPERAKIRDQVFDSLKRTIETVRKATELPGRTEVCGDYLFFYFSPSFKYTDQVLMVEVLMDKIGISVAVYQKVNASKRVFILQEENLLGSLGLRQAQKHITSLVQNYTPAIRSMI